MEDSLPGECSWHCTSRLCFGIISVEREKGCSASHLKGNHYGLVGLPEQCDLWLCAHSSQEVLLQLQATSRHWKSGVTGCRANAAAPSAENQAKRGGTCWWSCCNIWVQYLGKHRAQRSKDPCMLFPIPNCPWGPHLGVGMAVVKLFAQSSSGLK